MMTSTYMPMTRGMKIYKKKSCEEFPDKKSATYVDHRVLAAAHFEVPVECRYHAESRPRHEHGNLNVVLNFQPRKLHNH